MKKIYLSLLLFFPAFLFAQSFTTSSATGMSLAGPDSINLSAHVHIINNSSTQFNVMCRISSASMTSGHSKYFCFGVNCYDTSVVQSFSAIVIRPGQYDSLQAYAVPNHIGGNDSVSYQFYDNTGLSDTLNLTVTYSFTSVGIEELNKSAGSLTISGANPSNNLTALSYNVNQGKDARVVFHNLLGSVVKEIKLTDKQGILIVETSQFNSGIYVASLVVDSKSVVSKKLVVAHK